MSQPDAPCLAVHGADRYGAGNVTMEGDTLMRTLLLAAGVVWFCAAPVRAAEIGVEGKKLVIKDALAISGKAKFIYKTKYHSPVDKGDGTDAAAIDAQLASRTSPARRRARS